MDSIQKQLVPSYSPDHLAYLVGDDNTELPDDVVVGVLNMMNALATPGSTRYIGFYMPAELHYYRTFAEGQAAITQIPQDRDSIHIHPLQQHWVTTFYSAVQKKVYVYDSLQSVVHLQQICQQISLMYGQELASTVQYAGVTQQTSAPVCGPMAIAFAVSCYLGIDPTSVQYDLSKVRTHLKWCILNGTLTNFPTSESRHLQYVLSPHKNSVVPESLEISYDKAHQSLMSKYFETQNDKQQEKEKEVLNLQCNLPEDVLNRLKRENLSERINLTSKRKEQEPSFTPYKKVKVALRKSKLQKEQDRLRKQKKRLLQTDSEKMLDREQGRLSKQQKRCAQTEAEKRNMRYKDKQRKKASREQSSEVKKVNYRDSDKRKHKESRDLRSEHKEASDRDADKHRKKASREQSSDVRKASDRDTDKHRKKASREQSSDVRKASDRDADKHRKKVSREQSSELQKANYRDSDKRKHKESRDLRSEHKEASDKDADKHRKKASREQYSELQKANYRDSNKRKHKASRDLRSEHKEASDRDADKQRKKLSRDQRSELKEASDREADKQRKKASRDQYSELQKANYRDSDKRKHKASRDLRSEHKEASDRDADKQRKKLSRDQNSELHKANYRDCDKRKHKASRDQRSEHKEASDRDADKQRKKASRDQYSELQKANYRDSDKQKHKASRDQRSKLKEASDRDTDKQRKKDKRHPDSIERTIQQFRHAIKDGALYDCVSCSRLMYRRSVLVFKKDKYRDHSLVNKAIQSNVLSSKQWICLQCDSALKKQCLPPLSLSNSLFLEIIPPELQDLTSLELQLISQVLPFMKIIAVHTGAQHKLSGQVVLVPTDISKVTTSLPRDTENAQIVTLALKRRLSDKHSYHQQLIRPFHVNAALHYLKNNSPLYKNVQMNTNWEKNMSDSSNLLSSTVVSHNQEHDCEQNGPSHTDTLTSSSESNIHIEDISSMPGEINVDCSIQDVSCEIYSDIEQKAHTSLEQEPHIVMADNTKECALAENVKQNENCDNVKIKVSEMPDATNNIDEIIDSEDEVDNDNPEHVRNQLLYKSSLNCNTCLQPVNGPELSTNKILNIAPAEGQKPTTFFKEPNWESLAFPKLFPSGKNTFNSERKLSLSMKKYFNSRIMNKDPRFSETPEYIFQALDAIEREAIQNNISMTTRKSFNQDITVGHLQDPGYIKRLLNTDQIYASFKNLRGTPQYWQQMQLDMLAKLRQLGPYTFFLTGSAAEFHWVEVIQTVAKQYGTTLSDDDIENMDWNTKRNWLKRNPVTVARHIDYIFEQLWGKVILGGAHPIGEILNYDKRKEMQGRGTEHFHAAIHIKNAPKLDTNSDTECIQFIDKHVTCEMPNKEEDEELYNLVQRQVHHHTRTCKKNKNKACRFGYPKIPSLETLIARVPDGEDGPSKKEMASNILTKVHNVLFSPEVTSGGNLTFDTLLQNAQVTRSQYTSALQTAQRRTHIILKRSLQELSVNNYNIHILRALRANMDIQYITNIWACIAYLTSYICKPEKTMGEMMRKASKEASNKPIREALKDIGQIFIKSREVSEHEAISRILSLPLRKSNIDVQFIQTDLKANRTRVLKPRSILDSMDDSDTDLYLPSVHDKYSSRPDSLEDLCLADFVSMYTLASKHGIQDTEDDEEEEVSTQKKLYRLKNNMGVCKKRTTPKVIRYHNISKQKDEEMYHHRLLILYLPWRSEEGLSEEESFTRKYHSVKHSIADNIRKYEPYSDEVQDTIDNFDPDEVGPEMWVQIGADVMQESLDIEEAIIPQSHPMLDPDNLQENAIDTENLSDTPNTFTLSLTHLSSDTQFLKNVKNLNVQQRQLFDYLFEWASKQQLQRNHPFYIFLSGGAGCGKTYLINILYEGLVRALRAPGQDPSKPTVLMTASTGKAASNIDGITLHSAFGLPVRNKKGERNFPYKKINQSKLNTLRCNYANLKVIIADEISMLGSASFHHLSCALQDIFQNYSQPFAGISILTVGDLLQLNPVGQSPVFKSPKEGYDALAGSLWQTLFELTTIVRQKGDPRFAEILNNVRVGKINDADRRDLTMLHHTNTTHFPVDCVHLFRTNELAADYNTQQLKLLPLPHYTIKATDTKKDIHTNSVPVSVTSTNLYETGGLPAQIVIAVGAPFMLTNNIDTSDHLVNGAIGKIEQIDLPQDKPLQGTIYLRFDKSVVGQKSRSSNPRGLRHLVPIKPVSSTFFIHDKVTVPVERKMFPGILSYGLTVHKSQGSTYPYIIANFQKQAKCTKMPTPQGLAYTMLSRATCREGIQVVDFKESDITVNKGALEEIQRMRLQSPLLITRLPGGHLHIGHINIRSLSKHCTDLQSDPTIQELSVLCLSETHLQSGRKSLIPGYQMVLNPTEHGLAIFIKNGFHFESINFVQSEIQIMGIQIHWKTVTISIITVYKPPTSPVQEFLSSLQKHLINIDQAIILGDFNQTSNTTVFQVFFKNNRLTQYIHTPTHTLGGTLDLIISSLTELHTSSWPVPYTDHHLITVSLPE